MSWGWSVGWLVQWWCSPLGRGGGKKEVWHCEAPLSELGPMQFVFFNLVFVEEVLMLIDLGLGC